MLVSHISVSINSLTKGQLDLELLYGEFQYFPLKFPCEKKTIESSPICVCTVHLALFLL